MLEGQDDEPMDDTASAGEAGASIKGWDVWPQIIAAKKGEEVVPTKRWVDVTVWADEKAAKEGVKAAAGRERGHNFLFRKVFG